MMNFDFFLRQGQICVHMHLYGENVEKTTTKQQQPKNNNKKQQQKNNKTTFSQYVLKTYDWNLQCMIRVVKLFRYNQKFAPPPSSLSVLASGLYIYL